MARVLKAPVVMVVDDDESAREALSDVLEREGYQVVQAKDGLQALTRLTIERPRLVMLDLNMPVMDGREFLLLLQHVDRDTRPLVIVITAQIPGAISDVAAVLRKPVDIDHLLALTRRLLDLDHASNGASS
jgi:CheY-like chemotaxis protein